MNKLATVPVLLLVLIGCSTIRPVESMSNICELSRAGSAADGRIVRITALYSTDGLENSNLTDSACPGVVVGPYAAPNPHLDKRSLDRLDSAVFDARFDPSIRFVVDLSGEYRVSTDFKRGSLYIDRVWSFERSQ